MSRSHLHRRAVRLLRQAGRVAGTPILSSRLSRRAALQFGAALLAAGCARSAPSAKAKAETDKIAVVGGGAAGLTAAYRLAKAGRDVVVFEATNRFGGRMFTQENFTADGQFCELGGELVDSNHRALQDLAGELGLSIQPLVDGVAPEDSFDIGGQLRRTRDMLDPSTGTGAFLPIAARLAEDQASLLDADDEWTDRARALDLMSLADYLAALQADGAEPWAITVLDLAYRGEFGLPTSAQSALNMVDFIGVDTQSPFAIFGESDEFARIAGGSSQLITKLLAAMPARARLAPEHQLTAIAVNGGDITLSFATRQGTIAETFGQIVLALPFTRLRTVSGLDQLGLGPAQRAAIDTLGYGRNAKLMVATRARPWLGENPAGTWYSDRGFEAVWETSRAQAGTGGILTNFLSDSALDAAAARARLAAGLVATMPLTAAAIDPARHAYFRWADHPHTQGSYASPLSGQYTTLLEHTALPALGGRVQFAGEHTSVDFLGYMNGAIETGDRAASALLG